VDDTPDWAQAQLSDVAEIVVGYPFKSTDFTDEPRTGAVPLVRIRDVPEGVSRTYVANVPKSLQETYAVVEGDVLVGMDGNFHINQWRGAPAVLNQRTARVHFHGIDSQFGFYALRSPIRDIEASKHFTTVKHLSIGDLRTLRLPIPPIGEQRAIAHVLRVVQRARDETAAVVSAARALKRSLLHQLVKNAPGVESKTLGVLAELTNGKAFKASDWSQSGLPIIRIQNLNDRTAPFNYYAGPVDEKYFVAPGDLLFAWSGSKGTSFGAHIWTGRPGLLNQHIFKVQPRHDSVQLDYLSFALESLTSAIESTAYGLAALVHVRKRDLAATAIPLPPVDTQREIASSLDAADRKISAEDQRLDVLDAVFKSLLHDLMAGWRRVPPDLVNEVAEA
jgi:restriction endonuclease S subunit